MIDARELRKDNWVNAKHQGQTAINPYRIVAIEETTVKLANYHLLPEESVSDCEYADLEPIPLTAELFEKCGFEHSTFFEGIPTGVYRKNGLKVGLHGDDFIKAQYTAIFADDILLKVVYLHQLQNLYYALTGEELNINL